MNTHNPSYSNPDTLSVPAKWLFLSIAFATLAEIPLSFGTSNMHIDLHFRGKVQRSCLATMCAKAQRFCTHPCIMTWASSKNWATEQYFLRNWQLASEKKREEFSRILMWSLTCKIAKGKVSKRYEDFRSKIRRFLHDVLLKGLW